VEPHTQFEREGPHTRGEIEISYAQAVMGTEVEVETLHGSSTLEIPAGTEHGREFRLSGMGVPRLDGRGQGDHYARVRLEVPHPRDLTNEQIELLRQLAEAEGKEIQGDRSVLHRVRDLFG
jgi:molecular chaperone DnaJ